MSCFFCDLMEGKNSGKAKNPSGFILENELALGKFDDFGVSKGHMVFITKRHVETFFDTTPQEKQAIFELVDKAKVMIDKEHSPDGYNIGMNCKEAAGQSVMHVHVHLIPRYNGDVENPRGGVRGVIPAKRDY